MDTETRVKALAKHLGCDAGDIEPSSYDETSLEVGDGKYSDKYLVLTDDEADKVWDEQLGSYLEDCILYELPDEMQMYFDEEKWKRDARIDGRGHSISSYDGCEEEVEIDGETLYIFRID